MTQPLAEIGSCQIPWRANLSLDGLLDANLLSLVSHELHSSLVTPVEEVIHRPSKYFRGRLVWLASTLFPGREANKNHIGHAALAVELLHLGSLIVDDIQDGSSERRGGPSLQHMLGVPVALCAGNWLYFRPLRVLRELQLPPAIELQINRLYLDALEKAQCGQTLDLTMNIAQKNIAEIPSAVEAVMRLKTGAITALALGLGGVLVGAEAGELLALAAFGEEFGICLQYLDDIGNLLGTHDPAKRLEDITQHKPSGIWALVAQHWPDAYGSFQKLAHQAACGEQQPLWQWLTEHRFLQTAQLSIEKRLEQAFSTLDTAVSCDAAALAQLREMGKGLLHAYTKQ